MKAALAFVVVFALCAVFAQAQSQKEYLRHAFDMKCSVCQLAVNGVKSAVKAGQTDIKKVLTQECNKLKIGADLCKSKLVPYAEEIAAKLSTASSSSICHQIRWCAANQDYFNIAPVSVADDLPTKSSDAVLVDLKCSSCMGLFTYLYNTLDPKLLNTDLAAKLQSVCTNAPLFLQSVCTQIIETDFKRIIALFDEKNPQTMCEALNLCETHKRSRVDDDDDEDDDDFDLSRNDDEDEDEDDEEEEADVQADIDAEEGDDDELLVDDKDKNDDDDDVEDKDEVEGDEGDGDDLDLSVFDSFVDDAESENAKQAVFSLLKRMIYLENEDPRVFYFGLDGKKEMKKPVFNVPQNVLAGADAQCQICQWAVSAIEAYISQPDTEQQFARVLQELCTVLPGNYAAICQNFVVVYMDEAVNYIIDNLTPPVVCNKLDICSSAPSQAPSAA